MLILTDFVDFSGTTVDTVVAMSVRIAVIHYSATGNVHALASALADGAREEGAEVRLRKVAELAPEEAIEANPRWVAHRAAPLPGHPRAGAARAIRP